MSATCTYSLGFEELKGKTNQLWKSTIGEFIGNFILNFFASGACSQPEDATFKSLSFGLAVFIAITIIGHISGGHVNPAVTIAMLLSGRISLIRSFFYIGAQCLGSTVASTVVKSCIDEVYHNGLGHTTLAEDVSELQGLAIEFFLGLVLVLTVFSAFDVNKPDCRYVAPFAIGMSVTLGHLGAIRYTGCGMNPARTFGTAYATNNWNSHWIYWVGPISGGLIAALLYIQILEMPVEHRKRTETSDKQPIHAFGRDIQNSEEPNQFV